jgi:chaperone required for assembly of F1-ATPase
VHSITTLPGSALIALAMARGALAADAAWQAALVDEDWNMAQWGHDEMAMARRDFRFAEFQAAATVLSRSPG